MDSNIKRILIPTAAALGSVLVIPVPASAGINLPPMKMGARIQKQCENTGFRVKPGMTDYFSMKLC
jgi:hypothetical protein